MDSAEATVLYELRNIYGLTYRIDYADGIWRAARLGNSLMVHTADTSDALRGWLREDMAQWSAEARRHKS
jgi:hypothetical protein